MTEREPCNIGMDRLYDEKKLEKYFNYRYGAYQIPKMPNIAVYCRATVKTKTKFIKVHVLNLIGLARPT
jgi:hypothetical protein